MAGKRKVHFNPNLSIIHEPEEIGYFMHLTRKSNFLTWKADMMRMERMLTPILAKEHRKRIYKTYFCSKNE